LHKIIPPFIFEKTFYVKKIRSRQAALVSVFAFENLGERKKFLYKLEALLATSSTSLHVLATDKGTTRQISLGTCSARALLGLVAPDLSWDL
jgi:hypothetical protein